MVSENVSISKKPESAIIDEISRCYKCLAGENLCIFHANSVKMILVREAKVEIQKLICK